MVGKDIQFFFWTPKLTTALSLAALLIRPEMFATDAPAWSVAGTVSVASLATLAVLASPRIPPRSTLAGLALQAVLVIVNFAGLFRATGLSSSACPDGCLVSFATGLYFSVVTWTTLGYGDYATTPDLHLAAAAEALIGYIYFGLIVGLTATLYTRANDASE